MNGYTVIPAEPGRKQTYFTWGKVTHDNYCFGMVFKGCSLDTNAAVLLGDRVCVIDFDAHGEPPHGMTVFNKLLRDRPEIFKDTIIEATQSGGRHVYYKGISGQERKIIFECEGQEIAVEVKCGRKIVYCYPSVTENGGYTFITARNFLNTRADELPELHPFFMGLVDQADRTKAEREEARVNERKDIEARCNAINKGSMNSDLTSMDREAVLNGCLEAWKTTMAGKRHNGAVGLACNLAGIERLYGIGLTESDIRQILETFFSMSGRDPAKNEIRDAISWAYSHAEADPAIPWTYVCNARNERALKSLRRVWK